ncbi:hypothetical protein BGZ83_000148 [Gryganskiella cystojenkinii]|nr:hypothetical protein BGZ83_000148 [Gryganskiella cystojenkinii]
MAESVSQDLCLVDKILDKRIDVDTGEVEYLIRWLGADRDGNDFEDSWEPDYNVFGEELIEEFERMRAAKRLQHQTNKASRLIANSGSAATIADTAALSSPSPGIDDDGDEIFVSRKNQIPPRYYPPPQVPTALSSSFASEAISAQGGYQQVPSLAVPLPFDRGHPGHTSSHYLSRYPVMARPPRTPAPLPSYPQPSQSAFARNISSGSLSSAPSGFESTDVMKVDGADELEPHGEKRKRDGASVLARRYLSSSSRRGESRHIVRPICLESDVERLYIKRLISRSTLIKDEAARKELLMFLKNPEHPGLSSNATLLHSETWLVEVKKQQQADGTDMSLFLALDIPRAIAKALFISESALESERKIADPTQGIVLTDHSVVTALLMGDLEGSGLLLSKSTTSEKQTIIPDNSIAAESLSPPLPKVEPITSDPTSTKHETQEEGRNGSIDMHTVTVETDLTEHKMNGSVTSTLACGWAGCGQSLSTAEELQNHVMNSHLKGITTDMDGVSMASPKTPRSPSPAVVNGDSTIDETSAERSWELRYELAQDAYQSMRDEISQLKGLVQRTDHLIESSKMLYTSAIGSSQETIKRLEASLEWEKKKWGKYVDEKRLKAVPVTTAGNKNPADKLQMQHQPDTTLDLPMEAQAMNSIRRIERLLVEAKKSQEQLEKGNADLYKRKRALEEELQRVTSQYEVASAEVSELESKELVILEELKERQLNISRCRTMMEEEQEQSRKTVHELQDRVNSLMHAPVGAINQKNDLPIPPPTTETDVVMEDAASETAVSAPVTVNGGDIIAVETPPNTNHETQPTVSLGEAQDDTPHVPPAPPADAVMTEEPVPVVSKPTAIVSTDAVLTTGEPAELVASSPVLLATQPTPTSDRTGSSAVETIITTPVAQVSVPVVPLSAPEFMIHALSAEPAKPAAAVASTTPMPSIPSSSAAPGSSSTIPLNGSLGAQSYSSPTIDGTVSATIGPAATSISPPVIRIAPPPLAPVPVPAPALSTPIVRESLSTDLVQPKMEWHALEDPDDEEPNPPSTMNLVLPSTPDLLQLGNDEDFDDLMGDESVERSSSPTSNSVSTLTLNGSTSSADPLAGLLSDPSDFIDLLTKSLDP